MAECGASGSALDRSTAGILSSAIVNQNNVSGDVTESAGKVIGAFIGNTRTSPQAALSLMPSAPPDHLFHPNMIPHIEPMNEGKKPTSGSKTRSKKAKVKRTSTGKAFEEFLWVFVPQDHRILTVVKKECIRRKVTPRLVKTYFVCYQTDENRAFLDHKMEASGLEEQELYEVMAHYINTALAEAN